jgi:transglutaminase-like putative cysteine protease
MTSTAVARPWDSPLERSRLRPAEGWVTVAMVVLLVESFVWAVQDAGWVPVYEGSTAHLFFLALAAIFVEFVGAKAGWGRWRTHIVAAVIGGLLLPYVAAVTVASVLATPVDWTDVAARYRDAAAIASDVWADLVRDGKPFTNQFGHYHMVFAAIVWAAGMVATSAVFQKRRPFDAVVVVGILLLTNMTVTANPQLPFLVMFTVAALVLLVRAHSFDEQLTWVRRRIGDPSAVAALYLRGGASFVSVAVVGALALTLVASSAPLQGMWSDLPSRLSAVSEWLQKYAPGGGAHRGIGATGFTSTAFMSGSWEPAPGIAFNVKQSAAAVSDFKWLAGTYSVYDGTNHWAWGRTDSIAIPAGKNVLADAADDPTRLPSRREITFTVLPDEFRDRTVLSPQLVVSVDRDTTVTLVGGDRFTTLERSNGDPYTVKALIPNIGGTDGLTENKLRVTGRSYPPDVKTSYLFVDDKVIGPQAEQIYQYVKTLAAASTPPGNPYDFAKRLEGYLQGSNFQYSPDIVDEVRQRCDTISSVECFAQIRKGYCEYYATFMAILLRHDGIPSRIAYGYLRGKVTPDGTEVVPASNQHWWVQAYFAGYGWVDFDPTGHGVGEAQFIPPGPLVTIGPSSPGPRASGGREPDDGRGTARSPGTVTGGGTGTTTGTGAGPFIVIGVLLLLVVAVLVLTARRRGPRTAVDPDSAWGGLGRLASRFGFGPRPAQTVYEYAGALGDAVPSMRAELQTVARAKVEVAYGRQHLTPDRLRAVGDAYRRVRFAILRRGIVRWGRRRR